MEGYRTTVCVECYVVLHMAMDLDRFFGQGPVTRPSEHNNEPSGSVEGAEILD